MSDKNLPPMPQGRCAESIIRDLGRYPDPSEVCVLWCKGSMIIRVDPWGSVGPVEPDADHMELGVKGPHDDSVWLTWAGKSIQVKNEADHKTS